MDATKVYADIIKAINDMERALDIGAGACSWAQSDPASAIRSEIPGIRALGRLYNLKAEAESDSMKKQGRGSALQAVKRIAKNNYIKSRRGWFDFGGKQAFCDGCRAVILNDPIAGIPEVDSFINLDGVVKMADHAEKINLPSLAEVKTEIARQKAEEKKNKTYDFGEGNPMVDAEFLRDMLEALPGADAYAAPGELSNIYFVAYSGEGILLPIRKQPDR